jgi:Sulfotransferase family
MPDSTHPRDAGQAKCVLFLHIPKTAGTTLQRIIEKQYNPFRIYTIDGKMIEWSIDHFKKLSVQRRAGLRVVKGHMPVGLHEFLPQPSTYITFLRDPIARCISSYQFAKRNVLHPLHNRIARDNIDLPTFLDIAPWNKNLQCKLLAGLELRVFRPRNLLRKMTRTRTRSPYGATDVFCNDDTLHKARENIGLYFDFVGLSERFTESLILLKQIFGWDISSYRSYRRSRNRLAPEDLDPALVREVEVRNQFDRALYESYRPVFADLLSRAGVDTNVGLEGFTNADGTVFTSVRDVFSTALRMTATRLASFI